MKKGGVVFLLIVMMCATVFVHSISAVPSSRSLKSVGSNRHLYDEIKVRGRMGVELEDYSGTGANNHHDPTPPGGNS